MNDADNPYRALPQVQKLLEAPEAGVLAQRHGAHAVTEALRAVLASVRESLGAGRPVPDPASLIEQASGLLAARAAPGLRPVINATGIVIHTNLGRSPLAEEAIAAIAAVARGYSNLEFDLAQGRRGSRTAGVERLLTEVTGAEAALPVNNGAAAILLTLSAIAAGGEIIVSRGELVEIGGGFRIPDVIGQGGARLVEVGSTNKTRLADYAAAIGPETRVLLKVHQSNFRTIGFTEETPIAALAELAREHGLKLVVDLGSGLVARAAGTAEPTLAEAIGAGADVVTCSGDKLLGGPQAGLVLGRKDAVDPLRRHPLLRALRLDKLSLAALEATLRLHRDAPRRVPVIGMLAQDERTLEARAAHLRALLGAGEVVPTDAFAGGGALPEGRIASRALALGPPIGCDAAAEVLRAGDPPVVGRIAGGRLLLDMLTVADAELPALAEALKAIL